MVIENKSARWAVVSLLVLLLIPLVVMLGMMIFGAMGGSMMVLCGLWGAIVAAALVLLIVLLMRGSRGPELKPTFFSGVSFAIAALTEVAAQSSLGKHWRPCSQRVGRYGLQALMPEPNPRFWECLPGSDFFVPR